MARRGLALESGGPAPRRGPRAVTLSLRPAPGYAAGMSGHLGTKTDEDLVTIMTDTALPTAERAAAGDELMRRLVRLGDDAPGARLAARALGHGTGTDDTS